MSVQVCSKGRGSVVEDEGWTDAGICATLDRSD